MSRLKSFSFLLYSYIATEMLAPFFASFLILYSVFFLVTLLPLLDVVLDLKIGLADFIRLSCYIFPHMLLYVIPMACMIGVIVGFTRLTNDREMLVLKSSGISLRQLLPPVFIIALTISILTGFFSVKLVPAGELAVKHLMFQLAKEKSARASRREPLPKPSAIWLSMSTGSMKPITGTASMSRTCATAYSPSSSWLKGDTWMPRLKR
jgi:lipopolysaccharide export system permease protein